MATLSRFKPYHRSTTELSEMRPYIPGEDLTNISVSETDTLEPGGMVARDPEDHKDQWYVDKKYLEENLEVIPGS